MKRKDPRDVRFGVALAWNLGIVPMWFINLSIRMSDDSHYLITSCGVALISIIIGYFVVDWYWDPVPCFGARTNWTQVLRDTVGRGLIGLGVVLWGASVPKYVHEMVPPNAVPLFSSFWLVVMPGMVETMAHVPTDLEAGDGKGDDDSG